MVIATNHAPTATPLRLDLNHKYQKHKDVGEVRLSRNFDVGRKLTNDCSICYASMVELPYCGEIVIATAVQQTKACERETHPP